MHSILVLILFLVACFGVAAFGAQFAPGEWYAALEKPSWSPPAWVFGPVWTALYAMMAVAGWLVWRTGEAAGGAASWIAILAITLVFWRQRPLAGALLLPYLTWVGFAAALNLELWRLNPQA